MARRSGHPAGCAGPPHPTLSPTAHFTYCTGAFAVPAIRPPLLDLLAIGRVSNLPTVWSNVTAGHFLAWAVGPPFAGKTAGLAGSLMFLSIALVGSTCAYLFGTFLNDWKDAEFDRLYRPERAIPNGRLSRRTVLHLALAFASTGLLCFGFLAVLTPAIPIAALVLFASIAVYTVWHKKSPLAIIPMGLCRSLLYLLGFFTVFVPAPRLPTLTYGLGSMAEALMIDSFAILACAAIGILCYVAGLTLAARNESGKASLNVPQALFWLLIFLPFLTHTWWWIWHRPPFLEGWQLAIPALLGLLPFLLWTSRALCVLRSSIPGFVSRSLAGLCLADLLLFPGIAATLDTGTALDRHALLLALIPLALFLMALLLQRIAPAT